MNYSSQVSNFCEKRILGNPEYFSAFSALFITFTGFIGMKFSYIQNRICYNLLTLLLINGVASFLYHWFGWYIFKHLDEIPMIIAVWFGIIYILNKYNNKLSYVICNIYFVFALSINTIPDFQDLFPLLFGLPLMSMVPLICYEYKKKNNSNKSISLFLGTKGILLSFMSALIWIYTEFNCNKYLILAHSLWHIGMALGLYYVIISLNFLKLNQNFELNYKYYLFPVINAK